MEEEMNKLVTHPYVSSAFNFRSFTKIIGDLSVCQWDIRTLRTRDAWTGGFPKECVDLVCVGPEFLKNFLLTFSVTSSPVRTGALGPEPIGTWIRELISINIMLHTFWYGWILTWIMRNDSESKTKSVYLGHNHKFSKIFRVKPIGIFAKNFSQSNNSNGIHADYDTILITFNHFNFKYRI